jgi:hypothetical protein
MKQDYKDQKQPGVTMLRNVGFAIIGAVFVLLWTWIPDFALTEQECKSQSKQAVVGRLCESK